ncbi:uncharacterized protein LOC141602143 [Silene latifolia]|uniref:uncharacterized protein LOC141602143 n=1 Tax=Silene latifolia TaxID=37657 RepID=UPI003D781C9F
MSKLLYVSSSPISLAPPIWDTHDDEEEEEDLPPQFPSIIHVEGVCSPDTYGSEELEDNNNNEEASSHIVHFTREEDEALISSFMSVSQDSIVGTNQKKDALWAKVSSLYEEARLTNPLKLRQKTGNSIGGRMRRICKAVTAWGDCFAEANRIKRSGMSEDDVIQMAHKAQKEDPTTPTNVGTLETGISGKRTRLNDGGFSPACSIEEGSASNTRPIGRDAAKKGNGALKTVIEEVSHFSNAVKNLNFNMTSDKDNEVRRLAIDEEKVRVKEKKVNWSILSKLMDCSPPSSSSSSSTSSGENARQERRRQKRVATYEAVRFRMRKSLFLRIVEGVGAYDRHFQHKPDATGRLGLSPLIKCTAVLCLLAYGDAADRVDEYLRLGESTTKKVLVRFLEAVIHQFGDEYLRCPTVQDLQRLLQVGAYRGFPGMLGSIDCMHWKWKNCPKAWRGQFQGRSGEATVILEAVASQDLWI